MKYKRILLKLSGEALASSSGYGYDISRLAHFADEIMSVVELSTEVGIVIGGGNLYRGISGKEKGIGRVRGDQMGMLATVMNGLALQDALYNKGLRSAVMSSIAAGSLTEPFNSTRAVQYLESGIVVFMVGGTGNPFFTTDTAAALRAAETGADVLIKGTRVDGVYSDDPETHPEARKYETITMTHAYESGLKVMDLTAFTICRENKIPIHVLNVNEKGNLKKAVTGEHTGTYVKAV